MTSSSFPRYETITFNGDLPLSSLETEVAAGSSRCYDLHCHGGDRIFLARVLGLSIHPSYLPRDRLGFPHGVVNAQATSPPPPPSAGLLKNSPLQWMSLG